MRSYNERPVASVLPLIPSLSNLTPFGQVYDLTSSIYIKNKRAMAQFQEVTTLCLCVCDQDPDPRR